MINNIYKLRKLLALSCLLAFASCMDDEDRIVGHWVLIPGDSSYSFLNEVFFYRDKTLIKIDRAIEEYTEYKTEGNYNFYSKFDEKHINISMGNSTNKNLDAKIVIYDDTLSLEFDGSNSMFWYAKVNE